MATVARLMAIWPSVVGKAAPATAARIVATWVATSVSVPAPAFCD